MPAKPTIDADSGEIIKTESTALTQSLRTGIDTVNEHWRAAEHHHQQSCAHLIMAGHQLKQLRRQVKHGEWEPLFKGSEKRVKGSNVHSSGHFNFGKSWGYKLIKMADASTKQIPKLADLPFETNFSEWSEKDLKTLKTAVKERTDGETLQQLSWDWGLAKKPMGHGIEGKGNRKGGPKKGESEENAQDALAAEQEEARYLANKIIKDLNDFIKRDQHTLLTKGEADVFSDSLQASIEHVKRINRD